MKYGICLTTQLPVREMRSDRSEMVTQVLFGETLKILDKKDDWYFVYCDTDQYMGWIDEKAVTKIPRDVYQLAGVPDISTMQSPWGVVKVNGNQILVSLGSSLPFIENKDLVPGVQMSLLTGKVEPDSMEQSARACLGAPYLWGGRTIAGIDCSGFVLNLFKNQGVFLPRDASEQVKMGNSVPFVSEAMPGDVCFFDNQEKQIVHVGLYIGGNIIIHASGTVRMDKLDHQGIYNEEQKKYTHHLRIIKRISIK